MGELSEQNRALIESALDGFSRAMWDANKHISTSDLNRLLDAARTEGRGDEPGAMLRRGLAARGVEVAGADDPVVAALMTISHLQAEREGNPLANPDACYASPIREPEISREAEWERAEQAARLLAPEAWAEKDRLDASAFKGGYSAYLSKRLDESRKLARAILNLAPVGGRGEEGSSQSQPGVNAVPLPASPDGPRSSQSARVSHGLHMKVVGGKLICQRKSRIVE